MYLIIGIGLILTWWTIVTVREYQLEHPRYLDGSAGNEKLWRLLRHRRRPGRP
jgi:hypothetical protein